MLRTLLRKISIFFSIYIFNNKEIDLIKHKKIEIFLKKKSQIYFKKNPRLKTHKNLSFEIMKLINTSKLKKFLRNDVIQNIFFIHNRLFIFKELLELKKDKNWNLWKKLLKENNIGYPVPFFLYPKSSGNRIRQIFILKQFYETLDRNKLKNIKNIVEIGGGYGCLAQVFSKINKNINYTIYDMYEVNLLQYYFLKMNNLKPNLNSITSKTNLINKLDLLKKLYKKKSKKILIANWSISEFPSKFRVKFLPFIKNSERNLMLMLGLLVT